MMDAEGKGPVQQDERKIYGKRLKDGTQPTFTE
jgi:hypothetical protein